MTDASPPISLRLVRTVHGRFTDGPVDDLATADTTRAWLRGNGFRGTLPLTEEDAADVRALRETIYTILDSQTAGEPQRPSAVADLNRALRRPHMPPLAALDDGQPHRLTTTFHNGTDPDSILHDIAVDALEVITGPQADRIRQCSAEVCGSFFLDTSRAGNRRWCSTETCGNRARVAAHRSRAREEQAADYQ